jgi:hypothetical protein
MNRAALNRQATESRDVPLARPKTSGPVSDELSADPSAFPRCRTCGSRLPKTAKRGRTRGVCLSCSQSKGRVCVICGKQLARRVRLGRTPATLCGSARCRAQRGAQRRARARVTATCVICRREFQGSKYRPGVACSSQCLAALRSRLLKGRLRRVDTAACCHCGRIFRPRDTRWRRYCSRGCARRYRVRLALLRGLGRDG